MITGLHLQERRPPFIGTQAGDCRNVGRHSLRDLTVVNSLSLALEILVGSLVFVST